MAMKYKMHYLPRRAATVTREDWPKTWRSHAIFASQFPVLTGDMEYMRYTNRFDMADGRPVTLPDWISRDYDGVSTAAALTAQTFDGSGFTTDQRAQIDEDEIRVFADYTPKFSFYSKETLVTGEEPGGACLFAFLVRPAGMGVDPFMLRWHREHAAKAQALIGAEGIVRYAHNRPHVAPPANYPFDGIGEYWFKGDAELIAAVQDDALFAPLREDLSRFCDMERSVFMATSVFHGYPRPWNPGANPLGKPFG
jgi:hypothetical protein